MLVIGSHVSFGKEQLLGSVKEAVCYDANTFMFYTGAPQNTIRKEISDDFTYKANLLMKEKNIDSNNVICHAPYIVNPATNDKDKREFAIHFIKEEIRRCSMMHITKMVLHPGSHVNETVLEGLDNIVFVLNQVLDNPYDVVVLIETMAGKGNECGINLDELSYIFNHVEYKEKLGVCLDTCHLHDSGVLISDFNHYLDQFDEVIGIDKIKCVHINDSKNLLGSRKDRHENIGIGTIGFSNLLKVLYHPKLEGIPMILETPYITMEDNDKEKVYPPYKFEIKMIRDRVFNSNLVSDIRAYYKK